MTALHQGIGGFPLKLDQLANYEMRLLGESDLGKYWELAQEA